MFSGIIEGTATLKAIRKEQENIHFTFHCDFVNELKIDQSISHNGVCLTVVDKANDAYTVTAMLRLTVGIMAICSRSIFVRAPARSLFIFVLTLPITTTSFNTCDDSFKNALRE